MFPQRLLMVLAVAGFVLVNQPDAGRAQDKDGLSFEVYKDTAKEFRWRLKDADGKNLATAGQGYKTKGACMNGVKLIQKEADGKLKFEVYQDKGKAYRWRAKSPNGQVVASSSGSFEEKAAADKSVAAVKKGAAKATVEEVKD